MMMWNILVLTASFLLLVFLLWKEIGRKNKSRLIWRLLASVLAVAGLVCLAIPPFYTGKKSIVSDKEMLLLTDGFSKDSLDKYRNSSPQKPFYTANETVFQTLKSPQIHFIADLGLWKNSIPVNTQLHILGFGLEEDELQSLDKLPVRFDAPELPSGIQKINWTNRLNAGETFKLQGNFLNQNLSKIKLILKGSGTGLDSVEIAAKRSMPFSFGTVPKQIGQTVFRLVALSGKDTIENEAIPLQIEPVKTLKILMLSASPDFESRFLKNWLAENNYAIAARNTISKNKTTTVFGNMAKLPIEKITPALLGNFDALISDATEFGNLSKVESAAVLAQIDTKGLGLIIRADSSSDASFIKQKFAVEPSNFPQKQLHLKLNNEAGSQLIIQTDRPNFIRNQPNTQALVQDEGGNLLVNSRLYGSGKLILSMLNNTFSWQLSGNKAAYSAFWSMLLSKAAKKADRKENVFTTIYAGKNSMVPIQIETANNAVTANAGGTTVALSQDPAVPFLQEGVFWPRKVGWLPVTGKGISPQSIYIFENTAWKALKAAQKIRTTRKYAEQFNINRLNGSNQQKSEPIFVPPFWFYLLFLLCCSYLWFETKLL